MLTGVTTAIVTSAAVIHGTSAAPDIRRSATAEMPGRASHVSATDMIATEVPATAADVRAAAADVSSTNVPASPMMSAAAVAIGIRHAHR